MAKILVTGAGGFIGSHLTGYLVKKRHKVKRLFGIILAIFRDGLRSQSILMI